MCSGHKGWKRNQRWVRSCKSWKWILLPIQRGPPLGALDSTLYSKRRGPWTCPTRYFPWKLMWRHKVVWVYLVHWMMTWPSGPEWCFRAKYLEELQGEPQGKEEKSELEIKKKDQERQKEMVRDRQRQRPPLSGNDRCLSFSPSLTFVLGVQEILVNSLRRSFFLAQVLGAS